MRSRGFTLVEMLCVVAVLGLLIAFTVPSVAHYINEGKKAKEITAARKIIAAYLMYPADNNGALMPGYKAEPATDAKGQSLGFPANARYPWRLAPYLDYDMRTILFNGNENALQDKVDFHYAASVSPNLGMNTTFVGGDYGSASDMVPNERAMSRYGPFCVTRIGQVSKPSMLMVFASARRSKTEVGNYQIKSPQFTGGRWGGSWDPNASAESWGYVDMRYGGKAVAAMMDGHIALLDEDEIRDMRHWSNQAAEQDDPGYTLKRK